VKAKKKPNARGKYQLGKTISEQSGWTEKERVARLGSLSPFAEEEALLRSFFERSKELKNYLARKEMARADGKEIPTLEDFLYGDCERAFKSALDETISEITERMICALYDGHAGFFQRIAMLLPVVSKGEPVSPLDYALVNLQTWMEMEPAPGTKAAQTRKRYQILFPEWPPTISELRDYLGKLGLDYDPKSIRGAIERVGFPKPRKGKLGAPRRGNNSGIFPRKPKF
jgi:hypothetical protein